MAHIKILGDVPGDRRLAGVQHLQIQVFHLSQVFHLYGDLGADVEQLPHVRVELGDLCKELGITRQTLYRYVALDGPLREDGRKLLNGK